MTKDPYWFEASALSAEEAKARGEGVVKGDFASYAKVNRNDTLAGSGIESHNLMFAEHRARLYREMLGRRDFAAIADMGCGLGLTTAALAGQFPGAQVVGYEISQDAVEYGTRHFPGASFVQCAITAETEFGRTFDLILAQEFYAFTRTGDWAFQQPMLAMMLRHLAPGGVLMIELSERHADRTILANRAHLAALGARFLPMPFDRLYRRLPMRSLANIASWLVARVLKRDRNLAIVFEKPRG